MSTVAKRLYATDETFREVANLLFGDGADELVSKLSPSEEKKNRTQARIGLGSNIVGIGAGIAGLKDAAKNPALRHKVGSDIHLKPIKVSRGTKALAAGALGLQALNLGGDAVANRVLARNAKKKVSKRYTLTPINKMEPDSSDISVKTGRGKLRKVSAAIKAEVPSQQHPVERGHKKKVHKSAGHQSVTWEGEISKVDPDKRQVFGWASIVEVNGEPVVDLQGDYIDHDELEKSAYEYVIKSRKGGDMHKRNGDQPFHASDLIESFLVTPEKKEKLGLPDEMPTGWWVGYQVNDPEAWELVKSGKRTAFSIHGRGQREETVI